MKFKDFFKRNLAETSQDSTGEADDLLLEYGISNYQKTEGIPRESIINDPDLEISLFKERLEACTGSEDRKGLFLLLADFLDRMAENNRFWFIIPHDKLFITEKDQIVVDWFEFDAYTATDAKRIPSGVKQAYNLDLPPRLNSGMIKPDMISPAMTREAFVRFMVKMLYPQLPPLTRLSPEHWLAVALMKLGLLPEEKYRLRSIFHNAHTPGTCREIVTGLFEAQTNSVCVPAPVCALVWDAGFHTEQGRKKKAVQNEDAYHLIATPDKKSMLVMVSDGVSAADIGNGKMIANLIMETLELKKQELLAFMEETGKEASELWMKTCRSKIIELMADINQTCTERLNREADIKRVSPEALPMSATIILGMVNQNRAVFGHLGDSHIFYIAGGRLMRLNEEHNILARRIAAYIDNPALPAFGGEENDSHLDRVIPLAELDSKSKKYIPVRPDDQISFIELYPEPGASFIAATDGLIDSLGTTRNEFENEQDILKAFTRAASHDNTSAGIARQMGRAADEAAGVDNITLVVLTGRRAEQMPDTGEPRSKTGPGPDSTMSAEEKKPWVKLKKKPQN